jgi:hypothetical protein
MLWDACSWRKYLGAGETESELAAIRQCTHTGRPLGTAEFVRALEDSMQRRLAPRERESAPPKQLRMRGSVNSLSSPSRLSF